MKDFGLVVIGAHFGVWLEDKINEFRNDNILLVESFPYNNKVLKKNFRSIKRIKGVEGADCTPELYKKDKFFKQRFGTGDLRYLCRK